MIVATAIIASTLERPWVSASAGIVVKEGTMVVVVVEVVEEGTMVVVVVEVVEEGTMVVVVVEVVALLVVNAGSASGETKENHRGRRIRLERI